MKKVNNVAKKAPQAGFTLIEILIVIGIIAILAAIVLVAVNPKKQFEDAGNAQRASNVNAVLNAIGQYTVDSKGSLPGNIPSGDTNAVDLTEAGDLCEDLIPEFIAGLPADPEKNDQTVTEDECDNSNATGYEIYQTSGRVTITAPDAVGTTIEVTR